MIKGKIQLSLFKAKEGLRPSFDCYEGIITVGNYLDAFCCEKNSDAISEYDKCQRDVTKSRVDAIEGYLSEEETAFTGVVVFVNRAELAREIEVGDQTAVVLKLDESMSAHITDGQGRYTAFSKKLNQLIASESLDSVAALRARTLGLKLVVTNTEHVLDVKDAIRSFFADVHLNLKKPSTALSLFFSGDPLSRLMRSVSMRVSINGYNLFDRLATSTTLKQHQIMDYSHFRTLICRILAVSPKKANEALSDPAVFTAYEAQ